MAGPWEFFKSALPAEAGENVTDESSRLEGKQGLQVDTPPVGQNEKSNLVGTAVDILGSSAGQSYIRGFIDTGVWSEATFDRKEQDALRGIVLDRIGSGTNQISYKDYNPEGGEKIGYGMALPKLSDPHESLKFTIGRGEIVRDSEGNIMVADEYDFGELNTNKEELSVLEKLGLLYDAIDDDKVSTYGVLHMAAELFGPTPGEGASIRAKVGTPEELGLSEDDLSFIPTLEDYEKRNKGRIKQRTRGRRQPPRNKKESVLPPPDFIDTSAAFKRYGVVGGTATLDALKKTGKLPKDFSWATHKLVDSSGNELPDGARISKGMKVLAVKR